MKSTRKRVITVERRSQLIVLRGGNRFHFRCDMCGSESISLLPEGSEEERLEEFESVLRSSVCADDECRQLLEGETLPEF